jgi:thioredoxin 1
MNVKNMAIIGALVVAAAAIVLLKQGKHTEPTGAATKTGVEASAQQGKALPRLVDLGAGKCIPCKMMKPILEDLKATCGETFKTEFIDVWENPDAGKQYGINLIPTQIFYGADGKELYRHEGFLSKEDILSKWKELGVSVAEKNAQR